MNGPVHKSQITNHKSSSLVLASASPRRAEILTSLGVPFRADPADIIEELEPGENVTGAASRLAMAKAAQVAERHPGEWILAADTLVVLDATILGKPRDDADAARMLELLSGRQHGVVTAVQP